MVSALSFTYRMYRVLSCTGTHIHSSKEHSPKLVVCMAGCLCVLLIIPEPAAIWGRKIGGDSLNCVLHAGSPEDNTSSSELKKSTALIIDNCKENYSTYFIG